MSSSIKVPQRTGVLLDRIDSATDRLVSKFSEIVSLAKNSGNDRGSVASESFQIEADASTIVRAAEDLLFVTRSLKEAWILGQIRPISSIEEEDQEQQRVSQAQELSNKLVDAILQDRD